MGERNKKQCIVLLPSGPHYERLFDEILGLAIIETGLIPVRLQLTPQSPIPIDVFVDEIEQAEALFADISENTAEIWLAVGCAVALGRPLCLISSRLDSTLPLGIQYLPLIPYSDDAFPSDYAVLQQNIIAHLLAIVPQQEFAQPEPRLHAPFLPSAPMPALSDDLVSYEVMALTIIDLRASDAGLSPRDLGLEMRARDCAHLTSHAMNALKRRKFIERKPVQISQGNELHISENLFLTRAGQDWLLRHGKRTTAHRSTTRTRDQFLNNR
jgi:hypothetical protein